MYGIDEPALTDFECLSCDREAEIYNEIAKVLQNMRGGVGSAFEKLKAAAESAGVEITGKKYSNVFIGAVVE